MKKYLIYISVLAAALTAGVSCSQEESFDGNKDGSIFTLRFQTAELETRATEQGVGAENVVDHVDYFFFVDDNPTTEAFLSGRLTTGETPGVNLVKKSEVLYEYSKFDTESLSADVRTKLQGKSYLYILANYPETVTVKTMQDLLALPISTDFTTAQETFVMDSYNGTDHNSTTQPTLVILTPTAANEERVETIGLTRVAAKLVLDINVKDFFDDAAENHWTPVTSQMWVNFVNGRKNTTVAAEAVAFDAKANYYSTEQETPVSSTTQAPDGYTSWKTTAVYSYPQSYETYDVTAPYFKIFCPWKCDKKGMNNFYYKIILPNLGSFQRNKIYKLTIDLSVVGGTEEDWALVSDYIYVADWWAPEAIEASFEGAMYLDVPVRYYEIYGDDFIDIPVVSSNMIQITGVSGSKTNLYNGNTVSVTPTISNVTKDGFRLTHTLNTDMTSSAFDCTPITYTMTVSHTAGGLTNKTIDVTVVQYPSIYAEADPSNGYAYVNSYSRKSGDQTAYNNRSRQQGGQQSLGSLNQVGGQGSLNNNGNQYVVHVSVLPEGYKVTGMTEDVVIGDPRGGRLTNNYLGYNASGNVSYTVQANYNAVSTTTQNVIAPSIRIASSWGAQGTMQSYDRAEERCASYQENGYPAGRWRVPTVAEIDFLIQLSTYSHIPELFTCRDRGTYYEGYWSNGPGAYAGKPYTEDGHTKPYEVGTISNVNNNRVRINGSEFDLVVRCVYDDWYWSNTKYGNNGQPTTGNAATQWLGYIY